MIKDKDLYKRFETEFIRSNRLSFIENLRIFEAMWEEAVNLGVLPFKDPLEGIEVDIKIGRILNSIHVRRDFTENRNSS